MASGAAGSETGAAGASSPTAAAAAGSGGGSAGPSTSTTVPKATARASMSTTTSKQDHLLHYHRVVLSVCAIHLIQHSTYGASGAAGSGTGAAAASSPTAAAAAGSGGGSAGPSSSTAGPKATARASMSMHPPSATQSRPVTGAGTTASPFNPRKWLDEQCGKISQGTREHEYVERVCRCGKNFGDGSGVNAEEAKKHEESDQHTS